MSDHLPQVAFIIAARNAETTILRSVESVLAQEGVRVEVIVVNDHSTDATERILNSIQDNRLKVVTLSENVGRGAARNIAAGYASAPYLAIQDADDEALPFRARMSLELHQTHKDDSVAVVGGQVQVQTPAGKVWTRLHQPTEHKDIVAGLCSGRMTVLHPTAVISRQAFRDAGGYNVQFERAQDFELMLRLSMNYKLIAMPQVVELYTQPIWLPWTTYRLTELYRRQALHMHGYRDSLSRFRRLCPLRLRYLAAQFRRSKIALAHTLRATKW